MTRSSLAVDNCFASKRWISPAEWMRLLSGMGIRYAEAGADVEFDQLYNDPAYLKDWISRVKQAEKKTGVKVCNLYSGHGTYTTCGLAHPDQRNAERMLEKWIFPMLETAAELQCGLGFFCHAFPQNILNDKDLYHTAKGSLFDQLVRIAEKAAALGVPEVCIEQMYSPHQIPWTISGAAELLAEVKKRSGRNFYLTLDTGHQSAQRKFARPSLEELEKAAAFYRKNHFFDSVWLGPEEAYRMLRTGASVSGIDAFLNDYPWLFSEPRDADPYAWLTELGAYASIVHLQQTDGTRSAHAPFDEAHNRNGLIRGDRLLNALRNAKTLPGMPSPCDRHFLTLEIFAGTADLPHDILRNVETSVNYWKSFL